MTRLPEVGEILLVRAEVVQAMAGDCGIEVRIGGRRCTFRGWVDVKDLVAVEEGEERASDAAGTKKPAHGQVHEQARQPDG